MEETHHPYTPGNIVAQEYFRHSAGVMVPDSEPRDIKIRVSKPQAQYLLTQPLHESQIILEEDDDHIVFTFHVHPTWEFKSMIRALGSEAVILEPYDLRMAMVEELRTILENYCVSE